MLEPYEGKLSRTVLRGEGGSNALDLPDVPTFGMEAFLLPKVKEEIVNAWFRNWIP